MATLRGTDRVNAINATIASQGQAAPSAPKTTSSSGSGGGSSYTGTTYVSSTGKLLNEQGQVVGNAPAGTTGTFTEGVAPRSSQGVSMSTAASRPTSSKDISPTELPAYIADMETGPGLNKINTAQPSPTGVQATPFTQPNTQDLLDAFNQKGGPLSSEEIASPQDLASQYRQGLANVQAQGLQAPTTQGQAAGAIQSALPGAKQEAPSVWPNVFGIDPNIDKGFVEFDEWMSPPVQKQTLLEEYNQLSKSLGIQALNEEMIDAKAIIEGTEDDIRAEITAAGGFATDSQVLAMTNARNKSLIKNYNKLVDLRTASMDQLNTMMDLSIQDRKMASDEFDRKMNYAFKVAEFKERAMTNARDGLTNIIKTSGYDGLLNSTGGDPYSVSLIEKTLGIPQGGLMSLSQQSARERALNEQELVLDRRLKEANIANIYSQIGERNKPVSSSGGLVDANGKPLKLTATQVDTMVGFDNTSSGAEKALGLLESGVSTGPFASLKLQGAKLVNRADENQLSLEQSLAKIKADFMKSISGAAVSESEAKRLAKFLPEFSDQESVIKSKLNSLIEETSKSKANYLRTLGVAGGGGEVVTGPDGNEYMIIN